MVFGQTATMAVTTEELRRRFPLVNDHPDVAGVLRQPDLLAALGPLLAGPFAPQGVTKVIAPEARGPIIGALAAVHLGAGLLLARRQGTNHPGADLTIESAPTWRGVPSTFTVRSFDLTPEDRVLVVDDWITTGNSLRAVRDLVLDAGATYLGASVIVDKAEPAVLAELGAHGLVVFDEIAGQPKRA